LNALLQSVEMEIEEIGFDNSTFSLFDKSTQLGDFRLDYIIGNLN